MQHFDTIADVITDYVTPALGTYADDYDLDAIAREVTTSNGRGLIVNEDAFWAAVEAHEIAPA